MSERLDITEEFMNTPEPDESLLAKAKAAFEEWNPTEETIAELSNGRDTDEIEAKGLKLQEKAFTRGAAFSNSKYVNYTLISPNRNSPRVYGINRITPHCVVGQCSVEGLGWLFYDTDRQACSNYGIGADGRVGMYAPESDRSWCSSSWDNDQKAVTIECASDTYHPYRINDTVFNKLVDLCADICARNGKTKLVWFGDRNMSLNYQPKSNEMILTAHRWFASTICPGDYLYGKFLELANLVNAKFNGLHGSGSEWYYYKDGKVDTSKTGLFQNKYGWWYVKNGKVDFMKYGIVQNQYGWWRVENGKVNFGCNTVEENENGWWKCKNGMVDFGYTGIAQNKNGWWRCVNGKVDFTCNTVEQNEYGWWKCVNGKVDFGFNGLGKNKYGTWVCKNGKVDFSYNGEYKYNGTTYHIKNGKVVA